MISDVQSYASSYNGIKIVNKDECGGGRSPKGWICNDLQEGKNWSATISKQSYNATQH